MIKPKNFKSIAQQYIAAGMPSLKQDITRDSGMKLSEWRPDWQRTPVVLIPSICETLRVHFFKGSGYIHCLEEDACPACLAKFDARDRILISVFLPITEEIGVLGMPGSSRPKGLLPQLQALLDSCPDEQLMMLLISRDKNEYAVEALPSATEYSVNHPSIQRFVAEYEAGKVSLGDIYHRLDRDRLAELPEVALMLKVCGHIGCKG